MATAAIGGTAIRTSTVRTAISSSGPGSTSSDASAIAAWVSSHYTATTVDGEDNVLIRGTYRFAQVVVPTVDRGLRMVFFWRIAMAGQMPSMRSTSGFSKSPGMKVSALAAPAAAPPMSTV